MNFYFLVKLKIILFLIVIDSFCAAVITDQPLNFFKLGIELQEGTRLCPWADGEMRFQKEPIFSVSKGGKKLWEVVIDGRDIEFVTEPFSNHDKALLTDCMRTIEIACDVLKELNRNNKYSGSITFRKWINGESKGDFVLAGKEIDEFRIGSDFYISGFVEMMQKALGNSFLIDLKGLYFLIEHNALMTPGNKTNAEWVPTFKPQVTIQHKLEKTIPLFVSLFCFDKKYAQENDTNSYMVNYVNEGSKEPSKIKKGIVDALFSLKFGEAEDAAELEDFPTHSNIDFDDKLLPIDGMLFLHVYTCMQLASSGKVDERLNIKDTLSYFLNDRQVDAKGNLGLLSRRPFSAMWRDVNTTQQSFQETHYQRVSNAKQRELGERFPFVNYAEEYIDPINKRRMNLRWLNDAFDAPSPALLLLLENGIISTSMLRQLKPNVALESTDSNAIFTNYYNDVVRSVDASVPGYQFDIRTQRVEMVDRRVDALSPPYFLAHTDSMGAYKGHIDTSYGEAIVEVREIENIGTYALTLMRLPLGLKGEFLTNIRTSGNDSSLRDQVDALFCFLEIKLR